MIMFSFDVGRKSGNLLLCFLWSPVFSQNLVWEQKTPLLTMKTTVQKRKSFCIKMQIKI